VPFTTAGRGCEGAETFFVPFSTNSAPQLSQVVEYKESRNALADYSKGIFRRVLAETSNISTWRPARRLEKAAGPERSYFYSIFLPVMACLMEMFITRSA
jgi:hypothetical protein